VNPGREMSTHYFSCSVRTSMDSTKSLPGHVMSNMCFSSTGICGSHGAFQCIWGVKRQCTIFHAQVRKVRIAQKAHRDKLCRTCIFASDWIYRSRSALRCVRGVKHCRTFFSCSGGTGTDSTTSHCVTHNLCFPIQLDMWVT
jgi:hypothetical protein